jgi:DNA-binding transcriptional MerR regulator
MEYRVEELAAAAGVRIDTIRFYQAKGLLSAPRRVKRAAIYSEEHLATLRRIRRYQSQGLSLTVIKRLLASDSTSKAEALLGAVADEAGDQALTREQVAALSGVPEPLLVSLEAAGLLRPMTGSGGEARYGDADVQMARSGLEILGQGFPLDELLRLALRHARGVEEVTEAAIDLFDRHVRKQGEIGKADPAKLADSFRSLLPAVTTLVALHFQRTLLQRALSRLSDLPEREAVEAAIASVESRRLEVKWR